MEMKKLKVATKRMAGYTGVLGPVRFKDGVSEEYLPRHIRDRMAASMEFLEVDADGNEEPAGAQYRLIRDSKERAPKSLQLARQSEASKVAEIAQAAIMSAKAPVLETREGLEELASKGGIAAVREVAAKWNVKHRSIPVLIEMILDAQEKSIAARNKKLADKALAEAEKLKTTAPNPEPPQTANGDDEGQTDEGQGVAKTIPDAEPVGFTPDDVSAKTSAAADAINEKLKAAAASGDLAASISTQE